MYILVEYLDLCLSLSFVPMGLHLNFILLEYWLSD
jgi:hypothetical protein